MFDYQISCIQIKFIRSNTKNGGSLGLGLQEMRMYYLNSNLPDFNSDLSAVMLYI
jgi:hypothetical protein